MTMIGEDLVRATVRGFSRAIILWLIGQESRSGYAVMKEMKRLTGRNYTSGVIYPLLYRLEKEGFITGRWVEKGRRRIKYYSITEDGIRLLDRLREVFEMPVREVLEDLLGKTEI